MRISSLVSHAKHIGLLVLVAAVVFTVVGILDAEFFNQALAAGGGADQAFSKGEEKGNDLAELLAGKIAVTITTIAVIICGLLMQMGRLSHMVGIRIIIGAFIIGGAADIVAWIYG